MSNLQLGTDSSPGRQAVADPLREGSFVALRVWLSGSPWRLTGGWMVLAGLLAATGLDARDQPLLALALALVLAELLWMALWMQLVAPSQWPGRLLHRRPALPYIAPGSPAARLLGWQQPGTLAAIVRGGLPLVTLALLLAYVLSPAALALTAAATAIVMLGVLAKRAGLAGLMYWLHALLIVGLPVALGISLVGQWPVIPESLWLGGLAVGAVFLARVAVEVRDLPSAGAEGLARIGLILLTGVGVAALAGVMVFARQPLALGVIVLLAAAPMLSLARPDRAGQGAFQVWCLLLVLLAAAVIGVGLG